MDLDFAFNFPHCVPTAPVAMAPGAAGLMIAMAIPVLHVPAKKLTGIKEQDRLYTMLVHPIQRLNIDTLVSYNLCVLYLNNKNK